MPDESIRDIRVALVGYGLAGSAFHAPLIAVTPGLTLAAIVTGDPARRADAERRYPGVRVVPNTDALFDDAGSYDVAVIATPNRTHVPLASAALSSGMHVVVDKPLARTAAEGRRLVDEARRRGRMLTVYQNRRWDGDFLTVRRLLRDGALGQPLRFESRFERWRPVPKPGWRESGDPGEAGGILFDLGSHLIDQALVLFGAVTHVYAELDRRRPSVQVDDDAFVALTHSSGVRSHLHMSAVAAQPGPRLRILGTSAAYVKHGLDVQEAALRAGASPDSSGWGVEPESQWGLLGADEKVEHVRTEPGAYQAFYGAVAASIRDGVPPPVSPDDSVAGLAIIEAARRSASEGRVIGL